MIPPLQLSKHDMEGVHRVSFLYMLLRTSAVGLTSDCTDMMND